MSSNSWCDVTTRSKSIPVHTYKLPKREVGNGTAKGLLLDSCPAMELLSPGLALTTHESAKLSPLLREVLRFAHGSATFRRVSAIWNVPYNGIVFFGGT
jgi:hypothetical protein